MTIFMLQTKTCIPVNVDISYFCSYFNITTSKGDFMYMYCYY